MEPEIKVNEAIAALFYDQCMGQHSGHMSHIPNNPVLMSICKASGVTDERTFKIFLKECADYMPNTIF